MSTYETGARPMRLSCGASIRFQLLTSRKRVQEGNYFGSGIGRP
jgi:hypothetical protein